MARGGHGGGHHSSHSSHRSSSHRSSSSHSTSYRSTSSRSIGSGHSSSGRSSSLGGGRSYSSHSGSSYGHSSSGHTHYSHPTPPPPHYHDHHHHHHHYLYGGGYYSRPRRYAYVSRPVNILSTLLTWIFMIIIFMAIISACSAMGRGAGYSSSQSYSNIEREKFTGTVNINGYYSDDNVLYSDEKSSVESGLKHFYQKTGVCLYFDFHEFLSNTLGENYTDEEGQAYASARYEELFTDEGHLLIVVDNDTGMFYEADGQSIGVTLDDEAIDILYDYIDQAWYENEDDYGYIFGKAVANAADRIMYKKNRTVPVVIVVCIALIVIIAILRSWWNAKKKKEAEEQQRLDNILQTPLQTYGNSPVNNLASQYDNNPTPPNNGTPNYGAPNNATPNYGAPNNATPNYGAPNYGAPNNAAPNYGAPNNAAPNYGAPNNNTYGGANLNDTTNYN